jgi:hypothetical protein
VPITILRAQARSGAPFFRHIAGLRNLVCSRFTFRANDMPAVLPRKIARPGFACSLPQDYRMQLMLRAGLA